LTDKGIEVECLFLILHVDVSIGAILA